MSSLPLVGGDNNTWGTILNDYLQQSLDASGLLVTAPTNPWTKVANTNLASTSQPGLVQLAGDLGNTAVLPKVIALQGNSISNATPGDGNVLTWSASNSQWQPAAPSTGSGNSGYTGDIDGGISSTLFGGAQTIDCGDST